MIFNFGNYKLDIDVEKTKDFYNNATRVTDDCDCLGCKNYEKWVISLAAEPKWTLERMGIQLEKASEIYMICSNEDGSISYGGFYHLCGRIVQYSMVWNEISENHKVLNEMNFVEICNGYRIAFTDKIALLDKEFPLPVIQMEILAVIPWILMENEMA